MVTGRQPYLATPDPWSIGDIGILDNNQLANGPGIRTSIGRPTLLGYILGRDVTGLQCPSISFGEGSPISH